MTKKIFITDQICEGLMEYHRIYTPQDLVKHFQGKKAVLCVRDEKIKNYLKELSNIVHFEISHFNFGDDITAYYYCEKKDDTDIEIYWYQSLRAKVIYE